MMSWKMTSALKLFFFYWLINIWTWNKWGFEDVWFTYGCVRVNSLFCMLVPQTMYGPSSRCSKVAPKKMTCHFHSYITIIRVQENVCTTLWGYLGSWYASFVTRGSLKRGIKGHSLRRTIFICFGWFDYIFYLFFGYFFK